MTFLEALYGSQYSEIQQSGKDGNKGRLNGNLFLSAMIIMVVVIIVRLLMKISAAFASDANNFFHDLAGGHSGRTIGKLLAIPLLAVIYFVVSRTVGSEANFKKHVEGFMNSSDVQRQGANKKILLPFFGFLLVLIVLVIV